jgi:hypothetical protein
VVVEVGVGVFVGVGELVGVAVEVLARVGTTKTGDAVVIANAVAVDGEGDASMSGEAGFGDATGEVGLGDCVGVDVPISGGVEATVGLASGEVTGEAARGVCVAGGWTTRGVSVGETSSSVATIVGETIASGEASAAGDASLVATRSAAS